MGLNISSLIGGSIGEAFKQIVSCFKVDPTAALNAQTELTKIQLELQGKIEDAVSTEIQQAGDIIKAEANSQSWLARNVRPMLLLMWGSCMTVNVLIPTLARFWVPDLQLLPIPDWMYKLTAIGFTGYVTARTWEKVTGSSDK